MNVQQVYSSQLTADSPTYYRDCQVPQCHYETLEISVHATAQYVIWSESRMLSTYGYLYKSDFNSLKPLDNLLQQHDGSCNGGQFKFFVDLEINTRYVLVVTTDRPKTTGNFTVRMSGPENVTLHRIGKDRGCSKMIFDGGLSDLDAEHHRCVIGDRCNFYIKSIGLTLDDILRDELRPNMTFHQQSSSIKIGATLTIIMFVGGLVNSVLSLITFQNNECRQIGCGMYLLASSITSFLTISMFAVKFWFVVFTQTNDSTSLTVLRGGYASIEVLLKVCLYLDGWLNACVAIERAAQVIKGVTFDKKRSRHWAGRMIFILPFCIVGTLLHELLYRQLFVYDKATGEMGESNTNGTVAQRYVSCVTHYSASVQEYNTAVLLFHLITPFVANLCSALCIIFGAARQRSTARRNQSFTEHIREQFREHKQLIISPVILLILSIPRLIISLLPGCVKTSEKLWLYLLGYLISFIPPMLIFLIFVVPSEFCMKTFKGSLKSSRQRHGTTR